jgi:hypothetical protein
MGVYSGGYTTLPDYMVNSYSTSAVSPQLFVTDGVSEYVLEGGKKHLVNGAVKAEWGLSGAQLYADGTLDRYVTGSALATKLQYQGSYFLMRDGRAYGTIDTNIAGVWDILDAPVFNDKLVAALTPTSMLTRVVQSNAVGDSRLFIVDRGDWYHIDAAEKTNIVGNSAPVMQLNPNNAPNSPITDVVSPVVKSDGGAYYVIDGGGKRVINNTVIRNQWTANNTIPVITVSDEFLAQLPNRGIIERTIRGSSPTAYFVENNTKRHILYPDTLRNYLPIGWVSDALLDVLPSGSSI